MQHVFPERCNYRIKSLGQYSCEVNENLTIEIVVGEHLKMDGAVVGILNKQKPTPEIAQYVPNWDADLAKFMEKTFLKDMKEDAIKKEENPDTYDINDGGVVACKTTGGLAPATHLMLCQ